MYYFTLVDGEAVLWSVLSRLASWLMGKILS